MKLREPDLFAGMNKTERAYALLLEAQRRRGFIRSWRYERLTLVLADGVRLTPDFFVVDEQDMPAFHEVKGGFIRDDARVKLRVAAREFPEFLFKLAQCTRGQWTISEVTP
jgi:hypothetical protein